MTRFPQGFAAPVVVLASPLLLALGGCATSSDLRAPVPLQPQAAEAARAVTVQENAALLTTQMPARWWELFGDAQLQELEAEAASANLDLQTAALRVEESRAQYGLVNAARKPQVGAEFGYTRSGLSGKSPLANLGAHTEGIDTWSIGVQASWELDLWGYNRKLSESAGAHVKGAGYGQAAAQVSVAAEVARTYLLLRGVQAQQAIVDQNREIAEHLVALTESRVRNGVAMRSDSASAQADLAGITAQQETLQHQRDTLRNALALLLAKPPRALDERLGNAELPTMPAQLPIGVPSELARQRPDILAAEAQLQATVADVGAARADFYPRIGLGGALGTQAFNLSDLGNWSARQFSIGPTLHLPIFQGGRLRSMLALTQTRQQIAAVNYQRTVLAAWHEVDDALGAYASELRRHAQLALASEQDRAALQVAEHAYREGTAGFTTVLVARRSLLASQSALNDSATASALSVVGLYRALGGGWSPALTATPVATAEATP